MRLARSLTALSLVFFHGVLAANFTLVKEYSGGTFFDDWIFDEYAYDNTTGGTPYFMHSVYYPMTRVRKARSIMLPRPTLHRWHT